MSENFKIIISPTKTMKTEHLCSALQSSFPIYLDDSYFLIKKLKKLNLEQLSKTMSISSNLAEQNHDRFKNWQLPSVCSENWYPAAAFYSGEVYKGLDYDSLSIEDKAYAHRCLFILSGLYGIVRANDSIFPYRLEMGLSWKISDSNRNLYKFWEDKITTYLKNTLDSKNILINLASQEYYKAIKQKELESQIITPVFKTFKNSTYKTIAIHSKLARGLMCRYIIENRISTINQLKEFEIGGYCYNKKLSAEDKIVFVKK